MPFQTAELTTQQYDTLRGTGFASPSYSASEYVAFLPNTILFEARINGAPTGASFAQVTFDGVTIGAYTDVLDGMTVFIGADSDIRKATFVGRARANNTGVVTTATTLNINETSEVIADNAYIRVVADYRLWDRLARQVGTTQYKDYDNAFRLPPPLIQGLSSAYCQVANADTGLSTFSFTPTAIAITSGATISSWLWTVPSGMVITVGSTTTQNITATFESGFSAFITVRATDSNGKQGFFHFWVLSVAADFSNVVNLDTTGLTLGCDNGSWSGSLSVFAGVSDLLDNTLVVIFDVERYNGTQQTIVTNTKFVGRIRIEHDTTTPDTAHGLLQKADFDLEGALDQLGREEHLPFALVTKASPTKYDEITNLTIWRAIAYTLSFHTTCLTIFALSFDSTDNTFLYPQLPTQGGNIQGVINDLATSINANLQAAPTGELQIVRHADYLSTSQRSTLVTVANFTTTDFINLQPLTISEVDETGKVQASGGFYNSTSGTVVPLLSLAPGAAQAIGAGVSNFTRQVLIANQTQASAQSELNTRTGNEFAMKQRNQPEMSISFPPGYNWLVPSVNQWYTFTIAADFNTGGREYTTAERWLLTSVNIAHDNNIGSKSVQAVFQLESQGAPGQTVVYPAPGQITPSLPVLPILSSYPSMPPIPDISLPPLPGIEDAPPYSGPLPKGDGNVVVIWSATQVWVAQNFIMTSHPAWNEVTPPFPDYTVADVKWHGDGLLVLFNDVANLQSFMAYAPHGTSATPEWTLGEAVEGIYQTIRTTTVLGEVYIAGVTTEVVPTTCDLNAWVIQAGTEFSRTDTEIVVTTELFAGSWIATIHSPAPTDGCWMFQPVATGAGSPVLTWGIQDEAFQADPRDYPHTGIYAGQCVNAFSVYGFGGGVLDTVTFTVDDAIDCGGTTTIYTSRVAYSTDFGGTFAAPEVISPSLTAYMGFDTEKVGIPTLAGQGGQVEIATSAGGSYADYGDPFPTDGGANCIHIPRYTFGSITVGNINDSTPEYLAASSTLSADSEALWKVTASGVTFTDITINIGGDLGLAVSPNCMTMAYKSGQRIVGIMLFGSDYHLIVSGTTGAAFTDRGVVGSDAAYVRMRKTDLTFQQIFFADGDVNYSGNFGATIITKTKPTEDAIIGIEVFSI